MVILKMNQRKKTKDMKKIKAYTYILNKVNVPMKYMLINVFIQVSNFRKNPYIYGENASMVTSSVPVVEIPPTLWVDSKVPNVGDPQFKKYIPLINPRYSEQMIYFTFDVVNDGDAGLIYLKPDGFDLSSENVLLYSFYFSSATFPTSDVHDYKKVLKVRDWTRYGFKVFLPGGICGKGLCYLGIKPLKGIHSPNFIHF